MLPRVRRNGGFSLVELAIAVAIIGLVSTVVLQSYRDYIRIKAQNDTDVHRDAINEALKRYVFNFGVLPCPSGERIDPMGSTPNLGAGKGAATTSGTLSTSAGCATFVNAHPTHPWCDTTATSLTYGVCLMDGARGTGHGYAKDPVVIGSIPYSDLGLRTTESLDGWGNRFTYAVSFEETQIKPFDNTNGVIDIQSWDQNNLGFYPLQNPNDNNLPHQPKTFMVFLFSHGADGKGAYNFRGAQVTPCDTAAIDSAGSTGRDNENCYYQLSPVAANDLLHPTDLPLARFIESRDKTQNIFSTVTGSQHYDDYDFVDNISIQSDKWAMPTLGTMYNSTTAKVGIGISGTPGFPPKAQLDVNGNVFVSDIETQVICDQNGVNCFPQNLLSSTAVPALNDCQGGAVLGISDGHVQCSQLTDSSKIKGTKTCGSVAGTQKIVVGIDSKGQLVCQ